MITIEYGQCCTREVTAPQPKEPHARGAGKIRAADQEEATAEGGGAALPSFQRRGRKRSCAGPGTAARTKEISALREREGSDSLAAVRGLFPRAG